MLVKLFDIQNKKVIPSEHCYSIRTLKTIMDNYPDTYMSVYLYIFYMTCPDPDMNPFFNIIEHEKEEVIIEEAGLTPDSAFYFVDEIMDTLTLAAADEDEKVEVAANIAAEKIAEAKLMSDKGLTDETREALENADVSSLIEADVSPEQRELTQEKMDLINSILAELAEQIPEDMDDI